MKKVSLYNYKLNILEQEVIDNLNFIKLVDDLNIETGYFMFAIDFINQKLNNYKMIKNQNIDFNIKYKKLFLEIENIIYESEKIRINADIYMCQYILNFNLKNFGVLNNLKREFNSNYMYNRYDGNKKHLRDIKKFRVKCDKLFNSINLQYNVYKNNKNKVLIISK